MSFKGILPHTNVKFRLPSGKVGTGRVQADRIYPTHVVVSAYGFRTNTLRVVDESNYVSHARALFGRGLGLGLPPKNPDPTPRRAL